MRGRVLTVGREVVFLTLADGKTEGVLDLEELRDDKGQLSIKEGDELEARVAELGDKAGHVVLRRLMRRGPEAKAELQQAFELGIPVEGTVTAVNKGGVEVNVAGVRGFCPISQLDARQVEDAGSFIGRKLQFKITKHELDRRGVNLVVSRRALLEEEGRARAVETRQKLMSGRCCRGRSRRSRTSAPSSISGASRACCRRRSSASPAACVRARCWPWGSSCRCRSCASSAPTTPAGPSASRCR